MMLLNLLGFVLSVVALTLASGWWGLLIVPAIVIVIVIVVFH